MNHEETNGRGCAIVTTSSNLHSEGAESGTLVRDALLGAGHEIVHQRTISDDLTNLRYLFREWVDDSRVEVVVAIGGTGLAATDVTPEALAPLVTKRMPGFGEMLRQLSFERLGISALESRAEAAVCHSTLVYLLPGAPEAVQIALSRLILPQLQERLPTHRLRPTMMPEVRKPSDRTP
ncbi:MAG: molybdopterin-binding protein [Polyangiaceae bacterium]